MASSIGWVVHDRDEDDRINRLLAALKQSEARDELGFGGIRDSLADSLFPGTSTIQTRLRYFLIVPWCYRAVEERKVKAPQFGREVAQLERSLIEPLLAGGDHAGVFGAQAGGRVKRLPSSVYWSGLQVWGIRRERVSQSQYHRNIDGYYRGAGRILATEDGEAFRVAPKLIWHPALPPAPEDFPGTVDLRVRPNEAQFFLERLKESQPASLLTHLATMRLAAEVEFPWFHPSLASFPAQTRELLEHARLVSEVTRGASLLYNLLLARLPEPAGVSSARLRDIEDARVRDLHIWRSEVLRIDAVAEWSLQRLRELCAVPGHDVSQAAWSFLGDWVARVLVSEGNVAEDPVAQQLVRQREITLKRAGGRSRFLNPTVRAAWSGAAGIQPLNFRWGTVRQLLRDLEVGLAMEEAA